MLDFVESIFARLICQVLPDLLVMCSAEILLAFASGSDFSGANFTGANLEGVNLTQATLRGIWRF